MLKLFLKLIWLWLCIGIGFYIVTMIQPHDAPTNLASALIMVAAWVIGGGLASLHDLDDEGL